jgi:hypothetical protein
MKKLFCLALFLFSVSHLFAGEAATDSVILFAKTYENHAWGHVFEGITIDDAGNLWRFSDHSGKDMFLLPVNPGTPQGVKEEYKTGRKFIKKVDTDRMKQMQKLVPMVAVASMSPRVSRGRDIGKYSWVAYYFKDGKYKNVIFKIDGDDTCHRLATATEVLVDWLDSLPRK